MVIYLFIWLFGFLICIWIFIYLFDLDMYLQFGYYILPLYYIVFLLFIYLFGQLFFYLYIWLFVLLVYLLVYYLFRWVACLLAFWSSGDQQKNERARKVLVWLHAKCQHPVWFWKFSQRLWWWATCSHASCLSRLVTFTLVQMMPSDTVLQGRHTIYPSFCLLFCSQGHSSQENSDMSLGAKSSWTSCF